MQEYFSDEEFQKESVRAVITKDTGKAHGQVEIKSIIKQKILNGLSQKKNWKEAVGIVMEKKTIEKDGKRRINYRYFISSLKSRYKSRSVVQSEDIGYKYAWHLDVTHSGRCKHNVR